VLAVLLWATTTAGLGALTLSAADAVLAPGPARVEDAVTLAAGGAALALAWWLAVAAAASVAAAMLTVWRPAGALARAADGVARRTAPAAVRRAVVIAVGLSLSGAAAPALASPRPGPAATVSVSTARAVPGLAAQAGRPGGALDPSWPAVAASAATAAPAADPATASAAGPATGGSLDPGWVPAASPARTAPAPGPTVTMPEPTLRPRHAARSEVVVRRGDSLWAVVERYLGPGCTAAEVAATWPAWHAANLDVIGQDPDLLLPGQRLRPPAAGARSRIRPPVTSDQRAHLAADRRADRRADRADRGATR
jgi:hypothetical protein